MQQQKRAGRGRKASLFGFGITAFVLALASTAYACVAFIGQMTVDGHDGDTTVVGTGNSHAYCTTGRPLTAAAGHLNDTVSLSVDQGVCLDPTGPNSQPAGLHKLPAAIYEVRYNNKTSYDLSLGTWVHRTAHGCFKSPENDATRSVIGTFEVDANGKGSWSGTISPINGPDNNGDGQPDVNYSIAGQANNFCIGTQDPNIRVPNTSGGRPGLLAPYQMLI